MARLAVRKTTGSRGKTTRSPGKFAKRKIANTKVAIKSVSTTKGPVLYVGAMNQYFTQLSKYSAQRIAQYGKSDVYAKRINNWLKSARVQMRRSNIVNPILFGTLINIQKTLNGLPSAPKSLKSHIPSFFKSVKVNVSKDIIGFLNTFNKTLVSFKGEMVRLETSLKGHWVHAQSGKGCCTMDAALVRQFVAFEKKFSTFKTKWDKRLNSLSTPANRQLQSSIKKTKNELALVKKQIHANNVLISKILRAVKAKKAQSAPKHALIAKKDFTVIQNGWNKHSVELEKFRIQVAQFIEQLKAIKLV